MLAIPYRHPTANNRPSFGEIITSTLKDKQEVLTIPTKDQDTHEQANLLGASLEAGLDMYKDLQNTYLKQKQKTLSSKGKPKPPKRYVSTNKQKNEGGSGGGKNVKGEWSNDPGLYEMENSADVGVRH